MQGFNGGKFVTPDFTGQDLLSPFFDIELPAGGGFDHRDRKLPVVVSNNKVRRSSFDNGVMTNFPVAQETIDGIRINAFGREKIAPVLSKQIAHRALIMLTNGAGQRIGRLVGRAKGLLRHRRGRKHEQHHSTE